MTTEVEIGNLALSHINSSEIESFGEASDEAEQVNRWYNHARRAVLQGNPWKFAGQVITLELLTYDPVQWLYAYTYPTDCLLVKQIIPDVSLIQGSDNNSLNAVYYRNDYFNIDYDLVKQYKTPFEVLLKDNTTKIIATNQPDAVARVTTDITSPALFTQSFIIALSHYLASLIVTPIIGVDKGGKLAEKQMQMFESTVRQAVASDDIEKREGAERVPDMVAIRD